MKPIGVSKGRGAYALWHGGDGSYSLPEIPRDVEVFPTLRAAEEAFWSREHLRGPSQFNYINKPAGRWATPAVDMRTSWMRLYFADPSEERDPIPDQVIRFGPQGGVIRRPA